MARRETVVLTNMCMVYDGEGNMLVQDRLNPEWPGVTFPGGHVEPGESFTKKGKCSGSSAVSWSSISWR